MDEAMAPLTAIPMSYKATQPVVFTGQMFILVVISNLLVIVLMLLSLFFGLTGDTYVPFVASLGLCCIVYWGFTYLVLKKIGYIMEEAPKLRSEANVTEYVVAMQRAEPQVSLHVECSHWASGSKASNGRTTASKGSTKVTYTASHPFEIAASTDKSTTLSKNWQQPGEDGSLGTGFVAVVSGEIRFCPGAGATADKLKAEKERLYEENKHRDKDCSVTSGVSLPGWEPRQLYAPADAKFTKRFPRVAELLLVVIGLGAPLCMYYGRMLSRHIHLKVVKNVYIEGHAPPAQGGGGGAVDIEGPEAPAEGGGGGAIDIEGQTALAE